MLKRALLFGCFCAYPPLAFAADAVSFQRDIRPILSENCSFCHGPDAEQRQADLRLDTPAGLQSVIHPRRSGQSELYQRVISADPDQQMPPPDSNRRLSPDQVALLRRWIDEGSEWEPHWSFQPIERPPIPPAPVPPLAPQRNPIDRFVQAQLARRGMLPAAEASRSTLIRRVTLDLTGLPPQPRELDAFLADPAPDAYERLVDRLLQQQAYGERMAWDWLDAARYADSNGYQGDADRTMWPWRDWVISAFNQNLPYDQFTIWQLAGDMLPNATFQQRLATGFCRNHMINGEGGRIAEENRVDYVMDMTETMGTVWLGLTLNCCRCHDHKYDPFTRREYYELFALFNQTPVGGGGGNPQTPPILEVPDRWQRADLALLEQELAERERKLAERVEQLNRQQHEWETKKRNALRTRSAPDGSDEQGQKQAEQLAALLAALEVAPAERNEEQRKQVVEAYRGSDSQHQQRKQARDAAADAVSALRNQLPKVMVMRDQPDHRKTYLLARGLYNKPETEVQANVLVGLQSLPPQASKNRLGLAEWLVADGHPLTARVSVNRFWQQCFGVGLVKTTEDFGVQGERPVHAELLDWLAVEFRETGWDVKRLLRAIVTSHTYRQRSRIESAADRERDPENRFLARGPRYRLPSWMIRDQALAASGLLVRHLGGPPVNGYQPAGVWEDATFGRRAYRRDNGNALYRRSLYTFWRRIISPTMFFDNATRQTCTVKPLLTNTPLHALVTLNDTTYVEAARAVAQDALNDRRLDDRQRLDHIMLRLLCRPALNAEAEIVLQGIRRTRESYQQDKAAAVALAQVGELPSDPSLDSVEIAVWTNVCLAVFNLDETLSKE